MATIDELTQTVAALSANNAALVIAINVQKSFIDNAVSGSGENAADAAAAVAELNKLYLGAKSVEPSVDNTGQPLAIGALYFDSPSATMKSWNGSIWLGYEDEAVDAAASASSSAASATASQGAAASSATGASGSATTATNQAGIATSQATAALGSKNAAQASASAASSSQADALASQNASAASRDAAAASEASADTSEANALSFRNSASISASDALASRQGAEAALDSFDDRYLGAKSSAPTLDNDGAAIISGALYWDTVLNGGSLRVRQAGAWVTIPANVASAITTTPAGGLASTNVQAALTELDSEKANSISPSLTSPTVDSLNGGQLAGMRNRIINGDMRIDQRNNSGPITIAAGGAGYTLDRWLIVNTTNQTVTIQQGSFPLGGVENALRMRVSFSVAPTSGFLFVTQRVEGVSTLAGNAAVMSAIVATAELNMATQMYTAQVFGSGGSPLVVSSALNFSPDNNLTRYSNPHSIPATTGKTIGAGAYLEYTIRLSIKSTNAVTVANAQLEIGSVATPFEQRPIGLELMLCQRYYQTVNQRIIQYGVAGGLAAMSTNFSPQMARSPDVVQLTTYNANSNNYSVVLVTTTFIGSQVTAIASGSVECSKTLGLSAEL